MIQEEENKQGFVLINAEHKTVSTQSVVILASSLRLLPKAMTFHCCIFYIVRIQKELDRDSALTSYGKFLLINCGAMCHDSEEEITRV